MTYEQLGFGMDLMSEATDIALECIAFTQLFKTNNPCLDTPDEEDLSNAMLIMATLKVVSTETERPVSREEMRRQIDTTVDMILTMAEQKANNWWRYALLTEDEAN